MVEHLFQKVKVVDATALALRAGNIRTVNTVLLGTLSACLQLPIEIWGKALQDEFPPNLLGINREAFRLGRAV